ALHVLAELEAGFAWQREIQAHERGNPLRHVPDSASVSPLNTLRVASRAILRNKLRSFLTTLGIVIGVGAVIAMMAIGAGAKAQVEQAFAAMGTNVLIVLPGSTSSSGVHGGFGSMPTLTWDDLAAIRTEVATVKRAAPSLRASLPVVSEDQN